MELTQNQLEQIIPNNKNINEWFFALNQFLYRYEIDTHLRLAAFLSQCAHESGGFAYTSENLNYRWQSLRKTFPKYFSTDSLAQQYEKQPEKIANRIYANRMGNGSEQSGDGWKFRGRGLIQLTGKNNYTLFANSLGMDLTSAVNYLETFEGSVESACWFWQTNNLNKWADLEDMVTLTKKINGGTIGLPDRIEHYNHCLHILEVY